MQAPRGRRSMLRCRRLHRRNVAGRVYVPAGFRGGPSEPGPRPGPNEHGRMKIATFNVNGINGRLPVLLRWLAEARPDAVCLQELKAPQEKFPEAAIRKAGYGAIWHGQKSWNGVAILARGAEPIVP